MRKQSTTAFLMFENLLPFSNSWPHWVEKHLTETEKVNGIWKKQLELALGCLWRTTKICKTNSLKNFYYV